MNDFSTNLPIKLDSDVQKNLFIEFCNSGNLLIRDILIIHNIRLVTYVISMKFHESREKDDLFSVGLIGLIKAIDNYNSTIGEFSTFAISCIKIEILHYLRDKKEFYYMDDIDNINLYLNYNYNDSFIEDIEEKELIIAIMNIVENLPEKKRKIFMDYFSCDFLTQKEIAMKFNVSQQDISKTKQNIIHEIRKELELEKKSIKRRKRTKM